MQWMLSLWYITHINPNLNALVDHELITSLCKRSREVTIPVNICLKITSWLEVLNNQMEKQYADLLPVGPGSTLQGRSCSLVSEWVKVSLRKAQNKCTPIYHLNVNFLHFTKTILCPNFERTSRGRPISFLAWVYHNHYGIICGPCSVHYGIIYRARSTKAR